MTTSSDIVKALQRLQEVTTLKYVLLRTGSRNYRLARHADKNERVCYIGSVIFSKREAVAMIDMYCEGFEDGVNKTVEEEY